MPLKADRSSVWGLFVLYQESPPGKAAKLTVVVFPLILYAVRVPALASCSGMTRGPFSSGWPACCTAIKLPGNISGYALSRLITVALSDASIGHSAYDGLGGLP